MRAVRDRRVIRFDPGPLPTVPVPVADVESAWKGHEQVLPAILDRFRVNRSTCLEFGVEFGYSTAVLAQHFERVVGVDLFTGDAHTLHKGDHFAETSQRLARFENIELHRADYRDWISRDAGRYDLIHVDIVHTYDDTLRCGMWSARHADCVLFHDTESFDDVRRAVADVARTCGLEFHNYEPHHGLGILVAPGRAPT